MRLNIEHRTELIKGIKGQRIEGAFEDGVKRAYYRCYDPALAHESIQVVPTVTMPGSTTRTSSGTTPMATITTHAHTSMTKPIPPMSGICLISVNKSLTGVLRVRLRREQGQRRRFRRIRQCPCRLLLEPLDRDKDNDRRV
jgi:hypothetical protein